MKTKKMTLFALSGIALAGASHAAITVGTYSTDWSSESMSAGVGSTQDFGNNSTTWNTKALSTSAYSTGSGGHTWVDVAASGVTGQWLISPGSAGIASQTATITLTGVAAFDSISLDNFFVAAGGGIDVVNNVQLVVNGVTIVNEGFVSRGRDSVGWLTSYGVDAPSAALPIKPYLSGETAVGLSNLSATGSDFLDNRVTAWGHDALYNLGNDPAYDEVAVSGSGTVTIQIIGGATDALSDETQTIGNLGISFNTVPEPSSALLIGLGALGLIRRRR